MKCLCVRVFTYFPPITTSRRDALSCRTGVPIRQVLTAEDMQTTMKRPQVVEKILSFGSLRRKNSASKRYSLSVSIFVTSCCDIDNLCVSPVCGRSGMMICRVPRRDDKVVTRASTRNN